MNQMTYINFINIQQIKDLQFVTLKQFLFLEEENLRVICVNPCMGTFYRPN